MINLWCSVGFANGFFGVLHCLEVPLFKVEGNPAEHLKNRIIIANILWPIELFHSLKIGDDYKGKRLLPDLYLHVCVPP